MNWARDVNVQHAYEAGQTQQQDASVSVSSRLKARAHVGVIRLFFSSEYRSFTFSPCVICVARKVLDVWNWRRRHIRHRPLQMIHSRAHVSNAQ